MTVRTEKNGAVWTVIHDRYEARNAVNTEAAEQLHSAFVEFDSDPGAKVAVFYGAGGAFCGGWDLKTAGIFSDRERFTKEFVGPLSFPQGSNAGPRGPMGPSRLELSKPVIAAVEGAAVAGGMELAMWCDMRIMAQDAYFGVYCRRWGVPLIDGGTVRLPRLVGLGRAMELTLSGRKVDADEALRIGLCERIVPSGTARRAAEEFAAQISRFPQAAMLADRRSMIENQGLAMRDALRREWHNGIDAIVKEGAQGADRFASGLGRHGDFSEI